MENNNDEFVIGNLTLESLFPNGVGSILFSGIFRELQQQFSTADSADSTGRFIYGNFRRETDREAEQSIKTDFIRPFYLNCW